jgi:hypothetical protein
MNSTGSPILLQRSANIRILCENSDRFDISIEIPPDSSTETFVSKSGTTYYILSPMMEKRARIDLFDKQWTNLREKSNRRQSTTADVKDSSLFDIRILVDFGESHDPRHFSLLSKIQGMKLNSTFIEHFMKPVAGNLTMTSAGS